MLRQICVVTLALSSIGAAGCASSKSTAQPAAQAASPPRRNASVVLADELATAQTANVYDAIERLRPQWLKSSTNRGAGRGGGYQSSELAVYLETTRYGDIFALKQMSTTDVKSIRYLSASEATTRFGTGNTGGAIIVSMNK